MPSEILNAEERLSLAAVERLSAQKGEPAWMLEKRRKGWELFEQLPTPDWTRGIRGWWSNNLNEVNFDTYKPYVSAGDNTPDLSMSGSLSLSLDARKEVKTSGFLVQHNSEIVKVELSEDAKAAGVWFGSLQQAIKEKPELVEQYFMTRCIQPEENRITALHAALWSDGTFLYVPKNVTLDAPFQAFIYLDASGFTNFSHTLVVAEKGSSVKLIEEHTSPNIEEKSFNSGIVEIFIHTGAKVEYYNPQEWGTGVLDYSLKRALIGREGFHRWVVATLGSSSTWQSVDSVLEGENSNAETTGLSFSTGKQRFDVKTLSKHTAPHTNANTLFKAVLDDASQSGFQGAIRVLKPGQQTDSFLEDHTLFLSEASKGDALPSLDVDANDVRCSHGATIGMIDAEQIFYLQSRGLDREEAERMIVAGFFADVIQRIPLVSVRERLHASIERKLGGDETLRNSGDGGPMFEFAEAD